MVKGKVVDKSIKININLGDIKGKKKQTRRKKITNKNVVKDFIKPSGISTAPSASAQVITQRPIDFYSQQPPKQATDLTEIVKFVNNLDQRNKLLEQKIESSQKLLKNEQDYINSKINDDPTTMSIKSNDDETLSRIERLENLASKAYNKDLFKEKSSKKIKKSDITYTINNNVDYDPSDSTNYNEPLKLDKYIQKLPIVYKSDVVELNENEKSDNALNDLVTHQKKSEKLIIDIGADEFNDEREIEKQVEQMTQEMEKENEEKQRIKRQEAYGQLMKYRELINDNAFSFPEPKRIQLNKMSLSDKEKYLISKDQLKIINKHLKTLGLSPLNSKYWTKLKNDFDNLSPQMLEQSL